MFVDMSMGSYLFTAIVYLVLFLPSLAVLVRRLHDLDKSGWFYWVVLIPFVGGLILLVFMLMPSAPSSRWERSLVAPEAAE